VDNTVPQIQPKSGESAPLPSHPKSPNRPLTPKIQVLLRLWQQLSYTCRCWHLLSMIAWVRATSPRLRPPCNNGWRNLLVLQF
jgi:hypothetical protein